MIFQGAVVNQLGSITDPWIVCVTMEMTSFSDARAALSGSANATFSGSWANFTDLAISHSGNYTLLFNISSPAEASIFNIIRQEVVVSQRVISGEVIAQPSSIFVDDQMTITVQLVDVETGAHVDDIGWKVCV